MLLTSLLAALHVAAVQPPPPPPDDTLYGRSGKLRVRFVAPKRELEVETIKRLFGARDESAPHAPEPVSLGQRGDEASPAGREGGATPGAFRDGAARGADGDHGGLIKFIALRPFDEKRAGRVGEYRLGRWPAEKGRTRRGEAYENPEGFIEVTRENQDTWVSEHFQLKHFLTKDQQAVWPKYLVLREALVDKLELIIDELNAEGRAVTHLHVMSGFRSPQYNDQGVGRRGGRARDSRHQFGDAADILVDSDRNGRMDDLDGDRRVTYKDMRILAAAVDRVERKHPELVGGLGYYRATRTHGPFVHVDVRGTRARWGRP